ncbi:LPXTG cell wall anchor domain-containing protein [Candidatus Nanosynbacter sp. TM7-075]|nr:LPXTG cell wall anchor domain-containing protein [Candidatus Nanosynbacter sp. TM7-075]
MPTLSATPAPARQHKKLAITGASGDAATSAVALVALGGLFLIWARRRQTAHPED